MCGAWPTPSYQDAVAVGAVARMCSAVAGRTDGVGASLGDEHRHVEGGQDVVAIDVTGGEVGPHLGWDGDVPAHGGLQFVGVDGAGEAGTHERAHGPDVRRQVIGGGVHEVVEESGADQRAERGLARA